MKVLKSLKFWANLFFISFLVAALLWMIPPIFGLLGYDFIAVMKELVSGDLGTNMNRVKGSIYWSNLIWFAVHISFYFIIFHNLRLFVIKSVEKDYFNKYARKYLKFAAISCLTYGILILLNSISIGLSILYINQNNHFTNNLSLDLLGFNSPLFIIMLGLLFLYISKILGLSDDAMQENKLTI